jgi:riboflavin biosynthesis pyrimidine reductase
VLSDLPGAELIVLESVGGSIPAASVIAALRDRGFDSIVCEGGPSLAAQMIDTGLVDEFCLSTSPRVGGTPFPVIGPQVITEHAVTLTQLLRDETSGLYARWAFAAR